ncbi:MAG: 2-hydroxyacyl-CoA dehydratase [Deltaproteobacteria bacterium]|nr:2-hydroxyacyl-CoA dehydratase [Deltaproteobacteria bacterium]
MEKQTTPFEEMQRYYRQRTLAASKWKEAGGTVVGCVGLSIPEELIIAAGCLPIQVTGDPSVSTTEVGDAYMEDTICPQVCSIHNLLLLGKYDFLDLVIFPHGNDSVRKCYFHVWTEKHDLGMPLPALAVFDMVHTKKYSAGLYVRERMGAFKAFLEEFTGRKISDAAIAAAIEACNENRRLLQKVAALRREDPPRISGTEALQIIGASFFMPKDEHNKLLRTYLEKADELPAREGTRLFASGTIVDNTQLYELVEARNAVIVSEDICTGDRYCDELVDTSREPLDALVDRYHTRSHEGRMVPISESVDYLLKGVRASGAQGVVFNFLRWDDTHTWNYPEQRAALERAGIPSIAFEMQEYRLAGAEQLRTRVDAFVEMIMAGEHE